MFTGWEVSSGTVFYQNSSLHLLHSSQILLNWYHLLIYFLAILFYSVFPLSAMLYLNLSSPHYCASVMPHLFHIIFPTNLFQVLFTHISFIHNFCIDTFPLRYWLYDICNYYAAMPFAQVELLSAFSPGQITFTCILFCSLLMMHLFWQFRGLTRFRQLFL